MKNLIAAAAVTLAIFHSGLALAAQQTVTLAFQDMGCPSCSYIIRNSIEAVSGVDSAVISRKKKTAVVTFDNAKTNTDELRGATLRVGYASKLAQLKD